MRPHRPAGLPLVAVAIAALAVACQPSAPAAASLAAGEAAARDAGLPDTVRVKVGETAAHGELVLWMIGATDDRCPADAVCIRGGEARLRIRLATRDTAVEATLGIPGTGALPDRVTMGRYTVRALDLEPYPGTVRPEPPMSARTARFELTLR